MPDATHYIEFIENMRNVDTKPAFFPTSTPLGEQGQKLPCIKRERLFLESRWEAPSALGKEVLGVSPLADRLGRERPLCLSLNEGQ